MERSRIAKKIAYNCNRGKGQSDKWIKGVEERRILEWRHACWEDRKKMERPVLEADTIDDSNLFLSLHCLDLKTEINFEKLIGLE